MSKRRLSLVLTAAIVVTIAGGIFLLGDGTWRSRLVARHASKIILPEDAPSRLRSASIELVDPTGRGGTPAEISFAPSRVIRTAKLNLEIQDWDRFDRAMRDLSTRFGYLASAEVNTDDDGKHRAQVTLRIEASRFDRALADFKALGRVKGERITAEDVGRAYTDLEARRANKRVSAARLRDLIANRTGKLEEIIQAEQALGEVTEELERLDAQKRSYDSQLAYATLQADVFEPKAITRAEGSNLWRPLKDALLDTRTTLIALAAFFLEAVLVLAPWMLLGWLGWSLFRKRKAKVAEG